MEITVGHIGPARGLKGEVFVRATTDRPELWFSPGMVLGTHTSEQESLTVRSYREIQNRTIIAFEEAQTRSEAEKLRGITLVVDSDAAQEASSQDPDDEDSYYPRELIGSQVYDQAGRHMGEVVDVQMGGAQDLLIIAPVVGGEGTSGAESEDSQPASVLLPFVTALVPDVDVEAKRITIAPPGGLFADA
ncbi:MAG: ribosome maturation factor RimM [Actinomycetaceae bacterium]|nr:ribosome maturation factor RimM [Actinomycetaceae bacterium]